MIIDRPDEFVTKFSVLPAPARPVMRGAMLVDPRGFAISEQSARDNAYMSTGVEIDLERAHAQHAAVADTLRGLGVPVLTFPGRDGLADGIYPNNVFATARGRFIVGAMKHPVRRKEAAREDVRDLFTGAFGYELRDLSAGGDFTAELTGPLVLDRARGVGLCGLSTRADLAGCVAMHDAFGLEVTFQFDLAPGEYHTNIVLSVLAGRACVLHAPSFANPEVPDAIRCAYGGCAVELTDEEKANFAGNCIAVTTHDVMLSRRAFDALGPRSRAMFEQLDFRLRAVDIDELEKGGGSLRCLVAELF